MKSKNIFSKAISAIIKNFKVLNTTVFLSILLLLPSCESEQARQKRLAEGKKQENTILKEKNCNDLIRWGDIDICLPEIDGMKNTYVLPKMKKKLDDFEYKGNSVLAYYVSDDVYSQIDNIEEIVYDDYFKIYSVNKLKNAFANNNTLEQVSNAIKSSLNTDWQARKEKMEEQWNDFSFDKPVLIEDYYITPNVSSLLFLMKAAIGDCERIMVTTMNIVIVNDRVIYICYYKYYEGEDSIKKTKAKNDYFVLRFMDEN